MAEDWAAIAAEVAEALGEFQPITLHQPATNGTFDPVTETTSGASPAQEHDGSGVEDTYSAFTLASAAVEAGDVKFLLSPLKVDGTPMPKPVADSWTLTKDDGAWTIKDVERVAPAGVAVLYVLQLRR